VTALGILLFIMAALAVGGWILQTWLADRAEVEASPAEVRAQLRLGDAAGLAAKVMPAVSAAVAAVPGEPVVYVCGLGTDYHQRTCDALIRTRQPLALSQARLRHSACPRCGPPRE
jgi:hypothetical protein